MFDHFKGKAEPPSDETMVQRWRGSKEEVFHLIRKENIKENQGSIEKTMEAVTSSLDTVKPCASKFYIERQHRQ